MKKIVYAILLSLVAFISFTACTEEEVSPNTELNGGGIGSDPK